MNTLLLAQDTWDLVIDASGNIAMASDPYSVAQDVASACLTWQGELWYDTARGIPYPSILGERPPIGAIKSAMENEAATVPEVGAATCTLSTLSARALSGQIQITMTNGDTVNVQLQ